MHYRKLGRTGLQVSPLCLGAMMFGEWGNPDHDESVSIIHAALDAGHQLHRHRRRLLRGRVRGDRRQGARRAGATRSCWPPSSSRRWATGPNRRRQLAALDHAGVREQPAAPRHRPHRPLPGAPARPRRSTSTRRSARCRTSSTRARSATSARRPSPPSADRRGPVGRRAPRPRALRLRAAAVLDPGAGHRGATCCPTCQRYGMGVIPWSPLAGGWLSGRWRLDGGDPGSRRASRCDGDSLLKN